jgi:hypothetical protein
MILKKNAKTTKKIAIKKQELSDICFVIMPFGGWFDNYYTSIYCPAIEKSGLLPRRADDLDRPSNIVQDIWDLTKKSKLLLADLTTKNPNVFYELGLAHALAKPVIVVTESIDNIPFDLRSLRIIVYDKNEPGWGIVLQKKIIKAIKETLESPNETIPTAFLETKRSDIAIPVVTKQEKEFLEVKELIKKQVTPIKTNSTSSWVTASPVLMKHLEVLISGQSQEKVKAILVNQFKISERSALAIISQVLHESNDPAEGSDMLFMNHFPIEP